MATDIKALEQENEALKKEVKEKEGLLSEFVNASYDGYWDWYPQKGYEYMSPRFWEIFGVDYKTKKHDPAEWQDLIHPEDLKIALVNFDKHVKSKGKHPYNQEVRYKHAKGHWCTVFCRGKVIEYDDKGQAVRMIGTHTDITEHKKREAEFRNLNRRYTMALHASGIGVWEWNIPKNMVLWDEHMHRLFGFDPGSFPGTYDAFENRLSESDRARVKDEVEACVKNGTDFNTQYTAELPYGRKRDIAARGQVFYEAGEPVSMMGTCVDITHQKELERELAEIKDNS